MGARHSPRCVRRDENSESSSAAVEIECEMPAKRHNEMRCSREMARWRHKLKGGSLVGRESWTDARPYKSLTRERKDGCEWKSWAIICFCSRSGFSYPPILLLGRASSRSKSMRSSSAAPSHLVSTRGELRSETRQTPSGESRLPSSSRSWLHPFARLLVFPFRLAALCLISLPVSGSAPVLLFLFT